MTIETRDESIPGAITPRLRGWLESVVERGASDLLLVADARPSLKINGAVTPLDGAAPLASDDIAAAVVPALPPHARRLFAERGIDGTSSAMASSSRSKAPASDAAASTHGRTL